jgi:hypothetical protein
MRAGALGIEPSPSASKTAALPLRHTPMSRQRESNPHPQLGRLVSYRWTHACELGSPSDLSVEIVSFLLPCATASTPAPCRAVHPLASVFVGTVSPLFRCLLLVTPPAKHLTLCQLCFSFRGRPRPHPVTDLRLPVLVMRFKILRRTAVHARALLEPNGSVPRTPFPLVLALLVRVLVGHAPVIAPSPAT